MADNTPNPPSGAVPPRPGEAAKVQPKKETVRITLPPKPTAGPTVRLPSLPGGTGPSAPTVAMPSAQSPASAAPTVAMPAAQLQSSAPTVAMPAAGKPASTPAPAAKTPPPAARAPQAAGPAAAPRPAATPPASGPAKVAAPATVSGLDLGLAIAAVVVGLAVVVRLWLLASGIET